MKKIDLKKELKHLYGPSAKMENRHQTANEGCIKSSMKK